MANATATALDKQQVTSSSNTTLVEMHWSPEGFPSQNENKSGKTVQR